jgi:hypothetical protein
MDGVAEKIVAAQLHGSVDGGAAREEATKDAPSSSNGQFRVALKRRSRFGKSSAIVPTTEAPDPPGLSSQSTALSVEDMFRAMGGLETIAHAAEPSAIADASADEPVAAVDAPTDQEKAATSGRHPGILQHHPHRAQQHSNAPP